MTIYGPLATLRRAVKSGDKRATFEAAKDYIAALNATYYQTGKRRFTDSEDTMIRLGLGYIDAGDIADHIGVSDPVLMARARQLGINTPETGYNEDHLIAIERLAEKGASDAVICEMLNMRPPEDRANPPATDTVVVAVDLYGAQHDLMLNNNDVMKGEA